MYRYRDNDGVTKKSLKRLKHIDKLGKLQLIRGYIYKSKYAVRPGVLIKGENGSCRFSGFGWGYCGEGPRGLEFLLKLLNIPEEARKVILTSDFSWDKPKIVWEYSL